MERRLVTYMIFEELQPPIVFTFGFPHFHNRLDLKKKRQCFKSGLRYRSNVIYVRYMQIHLINVYKSQLQWLFEFVTGDKAFTYREEVHSFRGVYSFNKHHF